MRLIDSLKDLKMSLEASRDLYVVVAKHIELLDLDEIALMKDYKFSVLLFDPSLFVFLSYFLLVIFSLFPSSDYKDYKFIKVH